MKFLSLTFLSLFSLSLLSETSLQFGVIGSLYRPGIDQEKGFPCYKCHFRKKTSDEKGPVLPFMGIELGWKAFSSFGSLYLGSALAYTYASGHGLATGSDGKPQCDNPVKKASVGLHMYELRPQLTYQMDYFANSFPLFPYLKAGVIAHGYNFQNIGNLPSSGTRKPNGISFGYQAGLGLMLKMNFLEPSAVASARSNEHFHDVYLQSDLSYFRVDNFHNKGFVFSADDVMGSRWPLLWTFGLVFEI